MCPSRRVPCFVLATDRPVYSVIQRYIDRSKIANPSSEKSNCWSTVLATTACSNRSIREQEEEELSLMGNGPTSEHFPTTFMDSKEDVPVQPRRESISRQNRETAALVRNLTLPSPVRQAFPVARHVSPLSDLFDLLHANRSGTPSRLKTLETARGTVFLRDFCPPSLVERMQVESGLHAFARIPEREKRLLLSIAKSFDSALTLAHTTNGEIIGQVTIAPIEVWYEGLENAYEIAIEVSSNW